MTARGGDDPIPARINPVSAALPHKTLHSPQFPDVTITSGPLSLSIPWRNVYVDNANVPPSNILVNNTTMIAVRPDNVLFPPI